jgi:hypothetical protein
VALASEPPSDVEVALAAYEAEANGSPTEAFPPTPAACDAGEFRWERGADVVLCVPHCTADADCASFERCRVLDPARPRELLFAENFAAEFAAAAAQPVTVASTCVEQCAPAAQLVAHVVAPLAVCDPFANVDGALE